MAVLAVVDQVVHRDNAELGPTADCECAQVLRPDLNHCVMEPVICSTTLVTVALYRDAKGTESICVTITRCHKPHIHNHQPSHNKHLSLARQAACPQLRTRPSTLLSHECANDSTVAFTEQIRRCSTPSTSHLTTFDQAPR